MEFITKLDTELFFFLNSLHTDWLDVVMYHSSKTAIWIPLYGFLAYLIVKKFGKKSWIPLLCIAVCIICTDRITSGIMKPGFERLRPTHEPAIQTMVHTVKGYKGGQFGFASSHTANTFGIAIFTFLLLRSTYRWMGILFVWAFYVSYTRIYLGVHYPGDILAGIGVGLLCGWVTFKFNAYLVRVESKINHKDLKI